LRYDADMPQDGRRWNGWGFAGERFDLPPRAETWLSSRLGAGEPVPRLGEEAIHLPPPAPLPELGATVSQENGVRLRHACGQAFPDVIALRTGGGIVAPDGVVAPSSAAEVVTVLRQAAAAGVDVVIRGGGTSVVGGVTVRRGDRPVVVLALERLTGLLALDEDSQLATFAAGTLGPAVEEALAPAGLRLGHEPQSFELSTVGGWAATRSAGQRSTGVGKIEDLVAGLEVATAEGIWALPAQPASAAGPELRRLLLGSEGRFGVITSVTVRVRPLPACEDGVTVHLPSWEDGVATCRGIVQRGCPVEVMRLSDPEESSFAICLAHLPSPLRSLGGALRLLRRFRSGCLLLLGWAGGRLEVDEARRRCAEVWRSHRGLDIGRSGWQHWRRDRFRHPYLRDELLEQGVGVDTLETAARWSALPELYGNVRSALRRAASSEGVRLAVLCHLSHAYRDGASLYFTFFWPLTRGSEVARWRALKEAATDALCAAGGTVSHHHGVGTIHAPWLPDEVGRQGMAVLGAVAHTLDRAGGLNAGVLLARGRVAARLETREEGGEAEEG
jgi:alkyldihydroxyacetonephosphate synthase